MVEVIHKDLKGDEIPLMGKIVAVADTFDAMTTDRPYQKAMQFEDALLRIESFVGTRYDETVVAAFSAACREGLKKPGSVRLKKPTPVPPPEPVDSGVRNDPICRSLNLWNAVSRTSQLTRSRLVLA